MNSPKRTTVAVGSKPSEMFVQNWDKDAGHGQHRSDRLDPRLAMGNKKTPLGPGTLKGA